jgi:hypothetical protein
MHARRKVDLCAERWPLVCYSVTGGTETLRYLDQRPQRPRDRGALARGAAFQRSSCPSGPPVCDVTVAARGSPATARSVKAGQPSCPASTPGAATDTAGQGTGPAILVGLCRRASHKRAWLLGTKFPSRLSGLPPRSCGCLPGVALSSSSNSPPRSGRRPAAGPRIVESVCFCRRALAPNKSTRPPDTPRSHAPGDEKRHGPCSRCHPER